MTIVNAIIIGVVYALSEILGVSGSGHISIISTLFNLEVPTGQHLLFSAFLALGICISLCFVHWTEIISGLYDIIAFFNPSPDSAFRKTRFPDARLNLLVIIAFFPFFFILPINKGYYSLLNNSVFVGLMLFFNGLLVFVADKVKRGNKVRTNMSFLDAIIIGFCSAVAFLPGLSPIGVVISAGIVIGLRTDFAVTFAELLFIPVSFVVFILRVAKSSGIIWSYVPAYLVGMAVEIIVVLFADKLLRRIIENNKNSIVSYYCFVVGFLSIILSFIF